MARKLISLENTRFKFTTNFQGDPSRDKYRSAGRYANIIIPDHMMARELIDEGFNVRITKPREGEEDGFIPTYYVRVNVNYDVTWPPKIYIVTGTNEPKLLDEESIAMLDNIRVSNVNAVLSSREWEPGRFSLYVKTMYVEQDVEDDPFAARYSQRESYYED